MEVLCTTTRTGPVLLTRQDALLKLLPLLDRPEAKTFIAAAKLAVSLHLPPNCLKSIPTQVGIGARHGIVAWVPKQLVTKLVALVYPR